MFDLYANVLEVKFNPISFIQIAAAATGYRRHGLLAAASLLAISYLRVMILIRYLHNLPTFVVNAKWNSVSSYSLPGINCRL